MYARWDACPGLFLKTFPWNYLTSFGDDYINIFVRLMGLDSMILHPCMLHFLWRIVTRMEHNKSTVHTNYSHCVLCFSTKGIYHIIIIIIIMTIVLLTRISYHWYYYHACSTCSIIMGTYLEVYIACLVDWFTTLNLIEYNNVVYRYYQYSTGSTYTTSWFHYLIVVDTDWIDTIHDHSDCQVSVNINCMRDVSEIIHTRVSRYTTILGGVQSFLTYRCMLCPHPMEIEVLCITYIS